MDSAVSGVDGSMEERLKAEKEPCPDWLEFRMDSGRRKAVLGTVLLVM